MRITFLLFALLPIFNYVTVAQPGNNEESGVNFRSVQNSYYENLVNPVTFNESTTVYSRPTISSPLSYTLNFNTPLQILGEGEQEIIKDQGKQVTKIGRAHV